MPKVFFKKSNLWSEIKSIFYKKSGIGWAEARIVFLKKSGNWVKVFEKLSLPDTTKKPEIHTTNFGSGTVYDGPKATSPQYLDEPLYGKDGVYTNYTGISNRKFTYADSSTATSRTTIINGDLFTSSGGVTTANRLTVDEQYLFYELQVNNGVNYSIISVSDPVKMIKKAPQYTEFNTGGLTQAGQTVTVTFEIENYYYNRLEQANSKIRWWRSTNTSAAGTKVKEELLSATVTSSNSTTLIGTSSYTIDSTADTGFYIVVELVGGSSWTRHNSYNNDYQVVKQSLGLVTATPVRDTYPTISSVSGYKTKYGSGTYTGSTTDGTAYSTPIIRGNTGTWTPNPEKVAWRFQYSADGSTSWTSMYDFEGYSLSSGLTPDTSENQNHDWYLDDFYSSSGALGGTTSSTGKYVRFSSVPLDSNGYQYGSYDDTSAFGPIYAPPTTPGDPTLAWSSAFNSSSSYITAYWSASTTKFTYYLQYYDGSSWINLGNGTTTTPTSTSQFGPVLVPHGEKNFRVININADNVFAKSANVLFDPTPPPGNVSNVILRNFSTGNAHTFLNTGVRTTSVKCKYTYVSNNDFVINPPANSVSSSYPHQVIHNLISYFTQRAWTYDTYSSASTYYEGSTAWYAGNEYTAKLQSFSGGATAPSINGSNTYWTRGAVVGIYPYMTHNWSSGTTYTKGNTVRYGSTVFESNIYEYTARDPGFSNQSPTSTTYWSKTTTVTYNPGDYVYYNGGYYFCKFSTNGTYPTNTTYWFANYAAFNLNITPYNGTKAGTEYVHADTIFVRPDGVSDTVAISVAPAFSGITSSAITAKYTPSIYTNRVVTDVKKGSPLASINGYPVTRVVSGASEYTESLSNLSADTRHYFYLNPRYSYDDVAGVYYEGAQTTADEKTLALAPSDFTFSISNTSTDPTTPSVSQSRVSSSSNLVLVEIASSFPSDTVSYTLNISGAGSAAYVGNSNTAVDQPITSLNGYDSNGNSSASGSYEWVTAIDSGATTAKAINLTATALGKTRSVSVDTSVKTGASSWAINFTWSGATASGVTYYSNGTGTNSASTGATVTVYTNSMPVKIADITGANNPTVTINNVTAYSGTNQSGSSKAGTSGTTTSLSSIARPTKASSQSSANYIYYDPNPQAFTINNVTRTNGTAATIPTVNTPTYDEATKKVSYTFSSSDAAKYKTIAYGTAFNPDGSEASPAKGPFYTTGTSDFWYYDEAGTVTVAVAATNAIGRANVSWGASTNAQSYKVSFTYGGVSSTSGVLTTTSFSYNTLSEFILTGVTAYKNNDGTGTSKAGTLPTTTTVTPTETYSSYGSKSITVTVPFVTPYWDGTLPKWNSTSPSNFQRTTSTIRWGWDNGTFSFAGSVGTSKGWNWEVRNSASGSGTLYASSYKSYTTSDDTRVTVNGVYRKYLVYSGGTSSDIAYSSLSKYGRVNPYQFGTDGNEYNKDINGNRVWTAFL